MQVFKAAMRIFFHRPVYILIYIVWLGSLGIFIGNATTNAPQSGFDEERPTAAVIDRDGSDFSQGLSDFVAAHSDMVVIDDSERALQDATAQSRASYILIIPQGYGDSFLSTASSSNEPPLLDTVVSYESYSGSMMNNLVDEYLKTARTHIMADQSASQADITRSTAQDMSLNADVSVERIAESAPVSQQYLLYMQFSCYSILLSTVVCSAVVLARFNRQEVRRRNFAAPITSFSMNTQITLACLVITLISWAWICSVGLIAFSSSLTGVSPSTIAFAMLDLFCYALVALALGFLIGQLTGNELVMNAAANILGLVWSFLGGVWISLDLVGEPIKTIAKATPTYYYREALQQVFAQDTVAGLANMGMVLLFAIALLAIGFAIARLRRQTTESVRTKSVSARAAASA
jgi:ABC-2 type transport system permease protein